MLWRARAVFRFERTAIQEQGDEFEYNWIQSASTAVDDADGTDKRRRICALPERNLDQCPALDLAAKGRFWEERDSGPVLDGLLDVLDIVELRNDPDVSLVTP